MKDSKKQIKALILSMIMPGLGQFYNNEISKGTSLFLAFSFAIPSFAWVATYAPDGMLSPLVLLGFLLAFGIYFASGIDAFVRAHSASGTGPHNKIHIYLSILLFGYFFVLQQLVDYTDNHLVRFYTIPSESMSPNVVKGDYIFASKKVNCPGCKRAIQRGDVATFVYPNNRTTVYIKRIIGLPGDQIEINGTDVVINGKSIVRGETTELGSAALRSLLTDHRAFLEVTDSGKTYPVLWTKSAATLPAKFLVPAGQVFVLGDNRSAASDSRNFGYLPLTDIVGIAKQVFISGDEGFKFERTWKLLDLN